MVRESWKEFFNPIVNPLGTGLMILIIGVMIIACRYYIGYHLAPVNSIQQSSHYVTVTIARGDTLHQVSDQLSNKGLIKNNNFFLIYAKLSGQDKGIQAGTYRISSSWSLPRILQQLINGKISYTRVTIAEGFTVAQIGRLLVDKDLADGERFQAVVSTTNYQYSFLQGVPMGSRRLEGYLFPATYEIHAGITEREIIDLMLRRFTEAYTPKLQQRAQALGMTTMQVVTLASLVEREAKLDTERPVIAAVFENRLRRGMRLESCATVEYLLGHQKERLSYADLKIPSLYNTYLHEGLPPGPIANPGLASIRAVLYPVTVDYLYFVARGDGAHYFSRTLAEHENAIRRFQ